MSMLATFVQVDADLPERIRAEPSLAERLFEADAPAVAFDAERMRAFVLARGPQLPAGTMELDPVLRGQIEESLGRTYEALRSGEGGDRLFDLMQEQLGRRSSGPAEEVHAVLSLDKAWHGVHYVLCGAVEPGDSLASQAVLGGTEVGGDFSDYGPARCFTTAQVSELASALGGAEVEQEVSARYDPERMAELQIYPFGWGTGDRDWVLDAFASLRGFYADAAAQRFAVVTCLV